MLSCGSRHVVVGEIFLFAFFPLNTLLKVELQHLNFFRAIGCNGGPPRGEECPICLYLCSVYAVLNVRTDLSCCLSSAEITKPLK